MTLSGEPGDRLSLIPLGGDAKGVKTQGLVYPLDGEVLTFGFARGVSNRLESGQAKITVGSGLLWSFHERRSNVED